MLNHSSPQEFGPGLSRRTYLDQLTDTGYTGWYDEHGIPAPWPEDFCDPDSGWHPITGGDDVTDPPVRRENVNFEDHSTG